jgi:hypothetical protein
MLFLTMLLAVLLGLVNSASAAPPSGDFERDIAPLVARHCLGCHNASEASGGLVLVDRAHALAGGDSGAALVPGKPDESLLIQRLRDGSMPPEGKGEALTAEQVEKLVAWVRAGCNWPREKPLSPYEFTTDRRAGYDWWSLQPVTRPPVPRELIDEQPAGAIDAFVLEKLRERQLDMAPLADRPTLIRRLSFDLTGLPPTPEEICAFVDDPAADAYPRLVERLLASPHYGERWAQHWLDVVRFSESKGFERDRLRENAWRYRDWVVTAFNDDLPYDAFVRRQLAGDALAPEDAASATPTGFLVTGPNNDVGNGSELARQRERSDELDDYVSTATSALLGMTVSCARCHDHKFDPIPTRDYYRLVAVFSGVHYGDRPLASDSQREERKAKLAEYDAQLAALGERRQAIDDELAALGGGPASSVKNEIRFAPIEARYVRLAIERTGGDNEPAIDELEIYAAGAEPNQALAATGAVASASSLLSGYAIHQVPHLNDGLTGNDHSWIAAERGSAWAQIDLVKTLPVERVVWGRDRERHYTDRVPQEYAVLLSLDGETWTVAARRPERSEPSAAMRQQLAALQKRSADLAAEIAAVEQAKKALPPFETIWATVSTKPEPTRLLTRGDVTPPADEVTPGALSAVKGLAPDLAAADASDRERRLALAQWITAPENPLTARVMVNRVWQYHFGQGLVENASDFGFNGGLPSHPELLDWLAAEFVEHGWSLKHLHRLIVGSRAYRQACRADEAASQVDADNRLLWRTNRRRLDAESIRDSVLLTAGTLNAKPGGPSFRLFKYTDGNIPVFEPLAGEDRSTWRRTLYRHVVRSQSVPFLDVFDCPDCSVMTAKRSRTTTPLQALSLLNNDFVVRQSQLLAERLRSEAGADAGAQVERAMWLIFGRAPTADQRADLATFVEQHGLEPLGRVLWNANEFLYVN